MQLCAGPPGRHNWAELRLSLCSRSRRRPKHQQRLILSRCSRYPPRAEGAAPRKTTAVSFDCLFYTSCH
ncbi:hypothetical protein EYF80_042156 [Liparis tanakae]|uniref:Uncharacterized protein n=1 Tax=Liparis tanakae TaxID=230148 RepID=A0A4Z2G280_9TELE|nr:hypothetical protein EYF80_042156 [Liparis tanakae]